MTELISQVNTSNFEASTLLRAPRPPPNFNVEKTCLMPRDGRFRGNNFASGAAQVSTLKLGGPGGSVDQEEQVGRAQAGA